MLWAASTGVEGRNGRDAADGGRKTAKGTALAEGGRTEENGHRHGRKQKRVVGGMGMKDGTPGEGAGRGGCDFGVSELSTGRKRRGDGRKDDAHELWVSHRALMLA